jgi:putative transposase
VVFFDELRVKIRDDGLVKNKAVYVALALNADGEKDVLGLWIEQTEGAKFWLKVVNERDGLRRQTRHTAVGRP